MLIAVLVDGCLVICRRGFGDEERDVVGVTVNEDKGDWKKGSNSAENVRGSDS